MAPRQEASSEPQVTYSSGRAEQGSQPDVRLIHYNDVYHVDPSSAEPAGGFARFITMCREYQDGKQFEGQPKALTLFSGDAFNPSLESTVTKGRHMVPVLNAIRTDCACVGNHDFDFGVKQFRNLIGKCDFPWLLANVLDPALGDNVPLGNAKPTHMLTTSNGIKVGIIGLGEREWLETINSLPPNLIYKSASQTAKELVPKLREDGAEIVICLSHMREPNDKKLAEKTDGIIDIILGGHDHYYSHNFVNGTHVLRSGTDFKQLSYIEARRSGKGDSRWDFDIWRRDITSEVQEDQGAVKLAQKLTSKLKKSLGRPIGWTAMPLDARFSTVRLKESNMGNFVCDIMRHHHDADCTIMAAGTIRGDQVYPPGVIQIKDVTTCFPFEDPCILLRVTGQAIWDALENGVSSYPALEGRFPQVSNIEFEFDPKRESGKRLTYMKIGGKLYEPEKKYVLSTRGYMGRGKDGYDCLLVQSEGGDAEEIIDEENGILISTMIRQYFMGLRTVGQWKHLAEHWATVAQKAHTPLKPDVQGEGYFSQVPADSKTQSPNNSWSSFIRQRLGLDKQTVDERKEDEDDSDDSDSDDDDAEPVSIADGAEVGALSDQVDMEVLLMRKFFCRWVMQAGLESKVCDPMRLGELNVDWTRVIAPVLEGRIKMIQS